MNMIQFFEYFCSIAFTVMHIICRSEEESQEIHKINTQTQHHNVVCTVHRIINQQDE